MRIFTATPPNSAAKFVLLAAWFVMAFMVGGGIYENLVLNAAWPSNPSLIQPELGGVNRKVFWIPLHALMTLLLPIAIWLYWSEKTVRRLLLLSLAFYLIVRIWSILYFIPVALEFEAMQVQPIEQAKLAETWVALSPVRSVLSLAATVCLTICIFGANEPR